MEKLNLSSIDKKRYKYGYLLIFACFFLYTSSMAAKGIFVAETKYIIDLWGLTQAQAQLANAFYFVPYGLIQVGLFILINKINLRKYVMFTVPFAAITTALIGLSTGIEHVWFYFGLSGIFQAGIYCGCNYILTLYLPIKQMSTANIVMNTGYAVGTVFAYLISAFCIGYDLWRLPYFIIGAIFLSSVVVFYFITKISIRLKKVNIVLDKQEEIIAKGTYNQSDSLFSIDKRRKKIIFYTIDLLLTFVITSLYYGIMNFITSSLVEVHGVSQEISIYVSIIAPIAIIAGPVMIIKCCDRVKDFIKVGIFFTLSILPIGLLLVLFYDANVIIYLALVVFFIVIANGIKAIVLSVITFKMRDVINAGAYSAISNAVASVSAGVSPVIMGWIKDAYGWKAVYIALLSIVLFIAVSLIITDIVLKTHKKQKNR